MDAAAREHILPCQTCHRSPLLLLLLTSPAILPPHLQGYAGPLPLQYMQRQAELQKRIVQRMRHFGMTPVFPAFAGFVPAALAKKFPQVRDVAASPHLPRWWLWHPRLHPWLPQLC